MGEALPGGPLSRSAWTLQTRIALSLIVPTFFVGTNDYEQAANPRRVSGEEPTNGFSLMA